MRSFHRSLKSLLFLFEVPVKLGLLSLHIKWLLGTVKGKVNKCRVGCELWQKLGKIFCICGCIFLIIGMGSKSLTAYLHVPVSYGGIVFMSAGKNNCFKVFMGLREQHS